MESHRAILREIRASREVYSRRMGAVPPTFSYSFALLHAAWGGMKIVTEGDSLGLDVGVIPGAPRSGLTVGMLRSLSSEVVYLMGSTPAAIEEPAQDQSDDLPVDKLELTIMSYPPAARPRHYFPIPATIFSEDLQFTPLYLCTIYRPAGWPP